MGSINDLVAHLKPLSHRPDQFCTIWWDRDQAMLRNILEANTVGSKELVSTTGSIYKVEAMCVQMRTISGIKVIPLQAVQLFDLHLPGESHSIEAQMFIDRLLRDRSWQKSVPDVS